MIKTRVAILFGGDSPEHEVSIQSAKTVISALAEMPETYHILPVYITKNGGWLYYSEIPKDFSVKSLGSGGTPVMVNLNKSRPGFMIADYGFTDITADVVFPVLHGINGEDGSIQGLCRLIGMPCVGSGMLASALCMDKPIAKQLTSGIEGLGQVPFMTVDTKENPDICDITTEIEERIGFPCFVKPANAGSSRGISKVAGQDGLCFALEQAAKFDTRIIIERSVSARELEIAVLGNEELLISGAGEITTQSEFYDYNAKYTEGEATIAIPADIPADTHTRLRGYAEQIYRIMGCAGLARIDFFLEKGTNRILFNEINTIPGFTATSMFPKLLVHEGVDIPRIVDKLVGLALIST